MNKNIIATLVLAGSVLTTPLFAANFFKQLMPNVHAAKNTPSNHVTQKQHQDHTDFSGDWFGQCAFTNDNELSMSVSIENDEEHFSIDGEELTIGPLHTKTAADHFSSEFDHTSLEWNNDMSMLMVKTLYFSKGYDESSPMQTVLGQINLSLKDDQLIITGKTMGLINLEQQDQLSTINCTLNKK